MTDIERLGGIYPDFSEEQLQEIALGEKGSVDFTKYAKKEYSAEKMREMRLEMEDARHRAVAAFECRYFYGTPKYLTPFFNIKEELLENLIEEKNGITYKNIERWASSDGQLQSRMTKLVSAIMGERKTVDIFDDAEARLPEKYAEILKNIKVTEGVCSTSLKLGICGKADLYKTFGKGNLDQARGIIFDIDSEIIIKNKLNSYCDSYFSVAVKTENFRLAIAAVPNRSPMKSAADITVTVMDDDALYFDNASKYFDTSLLVKGLRS